MMRMSLAARLALLFALLSFTVLAVVGAVLCKSLANQLIECDRSQLLPLSLAAAATGALLLSVCAWWAAHRVLQPLHRLAQQTEVIGSRNLAVRIDAHGAPRELHTLIMGFNGMLDRLERSFTQLNQVAADMAHDLRTPIHNLLGQTEVALSQRREVAFYERLLGSNFEELQRLSIMTDNMLFLARAEHAGHLIARQALPAEEELKRIAEYFEGVAAERDLQLKVLAAGIVWADPMQLRRALANLIANAVRHAQAGSVIHLGAAEEGQGIKLSIENAGATIAPQHLKRLFDRFYRADPACEDSSSSSGLGLSIVRSIMTLHQGTWQVSSSAGVTRFSLWFPAAGE